MNTIITALALTIAAPTFAQASAPVAHTDHSKHESGKDCCDEKSGKDCCDKMKGKMDCCADKAGTKSADPHAGHDMSKPAQGQHAHQ